MIEILIIHLILFFLFFFSEIPNGWIRRSPNALWFGHENVVLRSKWTHQFGRSPASSVFWFGSTAPQTGYTSMILDRFRVGFGKLFLQVLPSTKTNKHRWFFYTLCTMAEFSQDFVKKWFKTFFVKTRSFSK